MDGARACHDVLLMSKRLGRALRRRWSGCHRRSRVEAKRRCINPLDQWLMARALDRQGAEVQIRALRSLSRIMAFNRSALNSFTVLGTPMTARAV